MKKTKQKPKTTTVSCDESTRAFIAAEAVRAGKFQREILADMVEAYKKSQKRSATKKNIEAQELRTANDFFSAIDGKLDTLIKRDEGVIGFIKKHESKLSSPTYDTVRNCETLLNQLVSILQKLQ